MEGPKGAAYTNFLRHDLLVMVSRGSGITPFISTIRELLYIASSAGDSSAPRIHLTCAFKKSSELTMLDLVLPVSGPAIKDISCLQLQIEAYINRENEPERDRTMLLRTVWFKTEASDALVSAILGRNSWLWLWVIISSSSVIFLLLIGILNRCYIDPMDHNSKARPYVKPLNFHRCKL